jgi:hypothetical protein
VEALKNALSMIVAIVGALTALLTLYAKYLDVKKGAASESEAADVAMKAVAIPLETTARVIQAEDLVDLSPDDDDRPIRNPAAIDRARQAVKAPAIALIAAGSISLIFNLLGGVYGYVDKFVTPLSTESRYRTALLEDPGRAGPPYSPGMSGAVAGSSDQATVMLTIFTLMTLSVASAAAIWAGYGMLRLRSYWLSVAGSIAIMPAGLFCCMGGIPIGIWSLTVLYKPEVAASFR